MEPIKYKTIQCPFCKNGSEEDDHFFCKECKGTRKLTIEIKPEPTEEEWAEGEEC